MSIEPCLWCQGTGMRGRFGCGVCWGSGVLMGCKHDDDSWSGTKIPDVWVCDGCGSFFFHRVIKANS